WRPRRRLGGADRAPRTGRANRSHHLPFARRPDREEFLPRPKRGMDRSTGVAGAAVESGSGSEPDHLEAGRAGRKRAPDQSARTKREIAGRRKDRMNRSRRQNCNAVNAASLARWIVLTAFLALTGL